MNNYKALVGRETPSDNILCLQNKLTGRIYEFYVEGSGWNILSSYLYSDEAHIPDCVGELMESNLKLFDAIDE